MACARRFVRTSSPSSTTAWPTSRKAARCSATRAGSRGWPTCPPTSRRRSSSPPRNAPGSASSSRWNRSHLFWGELQGTAVDAVAQAGWLRAVREHVAQVAAAAAADDLGAGHPVARVGVGLDRFGEGRLGEARPPGARLELGVGAEQVGAAARAPVHPGVLAVDVLAGEGGLGALLAQDLVLLGRELLAPLVIAPGDLLGHTADAR